MQLHGVSFYGPGMSPEDVEHLLHLKEIGGSIASSAVDLTTQEAGTYILYGYYKYGDNIEQTEATFLEILIDEKTGQKLIYFRSAYDGDVINKKIVYNVDGSYRKYQTSMSNPNPSWKSFTGGKLE